MPSILTTTVTEESTCVITAAFTDDAGASVVPNSLTWTLTDGDGTIINSRDGVTISPDSSVDIVLSGDDLAVGGASDDLIRYLLVEGTYDSDAGSNLPIKDQVRFVISDLVAVT